jgi:SAM-dependent methyltransferase
MQDWTQGYVTDTGYVHDYYPELNPQRARLALLQRGLLCPRIEQACELGFGQGVSVSLHAAAGAARWHGNDFNPAQAALARELVAASQADTCLTDESFAEFCMRKDLPDFDFIGMHGVWTWISDANRQLLVDFISRRLKPGGILYLSYNTLPGWAPFLPLRNLLQTHKERSGSSGQSTLQQVDSALGFCQGLIAAAPAYLQRNPAALERLQLLQKQHRSYLAHEFFNRDWQPMDFAGMSRWLAPAKLAYGCAANPIDGIPDLNYSPDQQRLLAALEDEVLRESVGDLMCNRFFRREYWLRGGRLQGTEARLQAIRALQVVLVTPAGEVPFRLDAGIGQARLPERIFAPVLERLADRQIHSLEGLESSLQPLGIEVGQLLEVVLVLHALGHLAVAQNPADMAEIRSRCRRLNDHLLQLSVDGSDIGHLASPITGGGIAVTRFQQWFLQARQQGQTGPEAWAAFAWQLARNQHMKIRKDDHVLETPDAIRAELLRLAQRFETRELPVLTTLEVAVA